MIETQISRIQEAITNKEPVHNSVIRQIRAISASLFHLLQLKC